MKPDDPSDSPSPVACPHCRSLSEPGDVYCSGCGERLRNPPSEPTTVQRPRSPRRKALKLLVVAVILAIFVGNFPLSYFPALLGVRRAQYNLGAAYKSGHSVRQDYAQAARWFKVSAEGGFAPAQFEYGVQRLYGLGVEENRSEAMAHLKRAADAGIVEAQFLAGTILLDAPQSAAADYREAEQWLRLAAAKRCMAAEYRLANEYIAGRRLPEDYGTADVLLNDLKDHGYQPAATLRDYLRTSVMTAEERERADRWEAERSR